MESGFQKTGWHWTRKGWKRTPKPMQRVKKVAIPAKRTYCKKVILKGIAPDASKSTLRKPRLVSAPTPAPKPETCATAYYNEPDAATERLRGPSSCRRSIHPPWAKPKPQPPAASIPAKRPWNGKYDDLGKPGGQEAR